MTEKTFIAERWLVSPGSNTKIIKAGEKNYVQLGKDQHYRVVYPNARDVTRKEPVEAIREGQDLTIRYPDGTEMIVRDYYDTCAGGSCSLALGDGSSLGHVLNPDAAVSWGGPVVAYSIADAEPFAPPIAQPVPPTAATPPPKPVAMPAAKPVVAATTPASKPVAAAAAEEGGWGVWTWIGIGGLAAAAAGGGGGGGGGGSTGGDTAAPTLTGSTPADNASAVAVGSHVVLTFSETVQAGSGSIVISNGTDTRTINVTDTSQVTFSGNTVTINPTASLQPGSNYHVQIASGVIRDAAGNAYAGIGSTTALDFSTASAGDTSAPTLTGSTPADDTTAALVGSSIVLNFSEAVQAGSGNIVINNGTDTRTIDVTDTSQVTFSGSTITINPTADLQSNSHYYVLVAASAVRDLAGNNYAGIANTTTLDFDTQDLQAPTLTGSTPADNATAVALNGNLVLTFSEAVQAGSGNLVISNGTDTRTISVTDTTQVTFSGSTVTISPTADLQSNSNYYVQIAAAAIRDVAGNTYAGIANSTTLNFTTADTGIPLLTTSTPADNATAVAVGSNIVLTFNEAVQAGTGNIVISDGAGDTRTISVSDTSQVTFSGSTVTINPTANLQGGRHYHVLVDATAIRDGSANAYGGISATTVLDFDTADTTAPTLTGSTPADNATAVAVSGNLVLTFSENVQAGSGNIVISNGTDTRTISVTDTSQVTFSGSTVTINPAADLQSFSNYNVQVAATAIRDAAGNTYAGIANNTTFNFATADIGVPVLTGSTPADNATAVVVGSNIVLTFSEAVQAGTGNIVISDGAGDTRTISITDVSQITFSGSTVTINPTANLQGGRHYHVLVDATAIRDGSANAYGGISATTVLDFDTEVVSPPVTAEIELSAVAAGVGGFVINGQAASDYSGNSVSSAGDVNGDGLADLIVGAYGSDPAAGEFAGRSYVVFGQMGALAVDLSAVAVGLGGFVINGQAADEFSGVSVSSAGDINGDGLGDLIVGAHGSDPAADIDAGRSYLVFGKTGALAVDLSAVAAGVGGFVINGQAAGDFSGVRVSSAGDVNGDGLADLIVGAYGSAGVFAGRSYLVFGQTGTLAVDLSAVAAGLGGFVINGQSADDFSGTRVSNAGDVNGDGLADLLLGVHTSDPAAGTNAGRSYVVFGKPGALAVDLSAVAAGQGGFVINGQAASDYSGTSVSAAGDVNGDGLADLIVGAYGSDPAAGANAGRSYVVFGKEGALAVDLSAVAAGVGGFVINGQAADDRSGLSVSSAGDINGDGLADLIVGANGSDPAAEIDAGRSYLVFGQTGTLAVDLSAVAAGNGGFVINGQAAGDESGISVSTAGDINGDGLVDLIVGALVSDPAAGVDAGRSYVIFGSTSGAFAQTAVDQYGTAGADHLFDGNVSRTLVSGLGNDNLAAMAGSVLYAGAGDDVLTIYGAMITALESPFGAGGNSTRLARIDGGSGVDTIRLVGSELILDLTTIANQSAGSPNGGSRIDSVECINLIGPGDNTLILSAADIRDIAGMNTFNAANGWTGLDATVQRHQLVVDGDVGDSVSVFGTWVLETQATNGSESYDVYNDTESAAQLLVNREVTFYGLVDLPPTLVTSSPTDDAAAVLVDGNIVLTFSESVVPGSGNIVISNGVDTRTINVTDTTQVMFSGNTVTINPTANLQGNSSYNVQMASGVIDDVTGNAYAGITTSTSLNFDTQDLIAPTLISSTPADNATAMLVDNNVVLTFSESVISGAGNVVISNGTDTRTISVTDTSQVTFSGSTVTINPTANLQSNSTYNVQMASGVIKDAAGNGFAGITSATALNFDTQDLVAPTLSGSTPADNATAVLVGSNIVLTFSEAVVAGTGSVVVSNGTDTRTISVSDTSQVTFSGNTVTINPTADLQSNSTYNVQMASGVIKDLSGNNYVGLSTNTVLNFDTQTVVPSIDLSAVAAGNGGYVINGQAANDLSGWSISSAGDVNGDELIDLIVSAPLADTSRGVDAGRGYVVFGQTATAPINLSAVAAGVGGFVINGQFADDYNGNGAAGIGDINGDGLGDVIVGAPRSDPAAGANAGRSYVVFGKTGGAAVELSAIAVQGGGFIVNGQSAGDVSGHDVSAAGDVNGDGLADFLIGADGSDPAAGANAGRSYVVFGKTGTGEVDLSAVAGGSGGFVINGQSAGDMIGWEVATAGDVNGDGFADVILGANLADTPAGVDAGRSYVVFGKSGTSAVNLSAIAAGVGGFVLQGESASDDSGYSVAGAGDVNGDGLSDLLVGAVDGKPALAGRSYVVFGRTATTAINLSSVTAGTGGFAINGQSAGDNSGSSVAGAGDINGDGLADLIVGAPNSDPAAGTSAGRSYVVFGKTGNATVELTAVANGVGGFLVNGQAASDGSGKRVSGAGDVNGDGIADLIVSAFEGDPAAGVGAGRTYIIFGNTNGAFAQTFVDQYGTTGADAFSDTGTAQTLVTGQGNDTLTATAASILYAGAGNDTLNINTAMITALQSTMGSGGNVSQLSRIDGGTGIDTLSLSGSALTLDLTQVASQAGSNPDGGSRIDSVERINITGSGNNTLILSSADIRDMAGMNLFNDGNGWTGLGAMVQRHQLVVMGNAGDSVQLAGTWLAAGSVSNGGQSYNVYNSTTSAEQLLVDGDIAFSAVLDLPPTLVSSTPLDNATAVLVGSNIVLTFSEAVVAGSGNIVISNGTDTRTISVTDTSQVTFSGSTVTINPTTDLQANSTYNVQMASGVIKDVSGNVYAGITSSTALNFDTAGLPVDLSDIAGGVGGFVINGQAATDYSGYRVAAAGDVNGDGLGDVLVSAPWSDPVAGEIAGRSYLVFGKTGALAVDLSAIATGVGGFVINGQVASDYSGHGISAAGDVNGDGLADILVGAPHGDPLTGISAGITYVVLGKTETAVVNLSAIAAGNGGFVINGQCATNLSGYAVSSAGDVNGDGYADLIIGAQNSDPAAGADAGRSYVVFGNAVSAGVELSAIAAGSGGFVINGHASGDLSGASVSNAGDVNGDGFSDLIVGAFLGDPAAGLSGGRSYLVFGKANSAAVHLSAVAAGTGGFVLNGQMAGDESGLSVSGAGDVNGDGLADFVIGARFSDPDAGASAGRSYVVFGKTDASVINVSAVAAGSGGFVINGQAAGDESGGSVSGVGDVNGDGLGDMIVGAYASDPVAGSAAGRSYLVFGKADTAAVDLSAIAAGIGGFVVNGQAPDDASGIYVAGAGDVNGDGLVDLIVGAHRADAATAIDAGRTYVIFGNTNGAFAQTFVDQYGTTGADAFSDTGTAQTLVTGQGNDNLTATAASILYAGAGDDTLSINGAMITALQSAFGAGGNITRLARIDGGAGIDTLSLSGSALTLYLTQVANQAASNPDGGSRIDSIERINITGSGNNTLILSPADIRDMAGMNLFNDSNGWSGFGTTVQRHQLIVDGNAGDTISVTGVWLDAGTVSNGGQTYRIHNDANSATQLLVDIDMTASVDIVPTLTGSTPADNAAAVLVDSDIVLTFSETVVAGIGNIVISNGTDTRTISVTDISQVTFSGSMVTINPTSDLLGSSTYNVQLAGGVINDATGNGFAGMTGSTTFDFTTGMPPVDLSKIAAGSGGFVINGQAPGDHSGRSVSNAGDVNGDGLADLIVGAYWSDPVAGTSAGRSYVVYGKSTSAAVDLSAVAAGTGGFVINGQAASDESGVSVSSAGDVNGDGLVDLIVGASGSDPVAGKSAGRSYVVYGKSTSAAVDLSAVVAGTGGFVINGQASDDYSGVSVSSAGDVNGDGLADLIVGAHGGDNFPLSTVGRSYVVYGQSNTAAVDLSAVAAGTGGFVINGQASLDSSGLSVSSAGDVNGDGLADLIVGAYLSDPVAGIDAGRSYVVYGKINSGAVDLSAVAAGNGGFVINGQAATDYSGISVSSAGDVNGDGLADLIVGARGSSLAAGTGTGRSYVVYGKNNSAAIDLSAVAAGSGGFIINGQSEDDQSGVSVSSAGDVNGDGLADLIVGAHQSDPTAGVSAGRSYVVYGKSNSAAVDLSAVAVGNGGFVLNGQAAFDSSGRSVSSAGDVNGDGLADLIVGAYVSDPVAGSLAGRSYVIFGNTAGAFTQTFVDQYGTNGADSFNDAGSSQTLVTGQGNDNLTATAASVLYGGAGNDSFVIDNAMITALQSAMGSGGNANQLARIDGGTGLDSLLLSGSGLTLDLTQVANQAASNPDGGSRIDSVEKIDLTGTGNNTVVLKLNDVLDMGSANTFATTGRQQLLVTGNAGDTVDLADASGKTNWTQSGTQVVDSVTYNAWNHNTSLATVYVAQGVSVI